MCTPVTSSEVTSSCSSRFRYFKCHPPFARTASARREGGVAISQIRRCQDGGRQWANGHRCSEEETRTLLCMRHGQRLDYPIQGGNEQMRNLALSIAAILVLAVVSPAFAQPFADVPTDHWAFDAIAELAAKGIIEGFPDGTFKGDRGVTRYEVAMIVARILARIEAIKIPAPAAPAPAPQVTRADVQTIQRLVNEFRAELAALGVRVTAVEEELTALKQQKDNVTVKGDVRVRYTFPDGALNSVAYRNRITITGKAAPNVSATARLRVGQYNFGTAGAGFPTVAFDYTYADFSGLFGFNWRLGQQAYTLGGGVGWSGYGLLYDPSNAGIFSATAATTGLKVTGSLAGFGFELGGWRQSDEVANTATDLGFDIYTVRAETDMFAGWTLGLSGLYQHRTAAVTVTTTAAGATPGTTAATANTNDTGYQVDLKGGLFPGVGLGLAYATFTPGTAGAASSNAYIGWVDIDLSAMGMAAMAPTLTAWYKDYGSTASVQIPFQTGASTDVETGDYTAWNFKGFGAALSLDFGSGWSGSFAYESGDQKITGGSSVQEYWAEFAYALAQNTAIKFNYLKAQLGGVDQDNRYRVEFTYSY